MTHVNTAQSTGFETIGFNDEQGHWDNIDKDVAGYLKTLDTDGHMIYHSQYRLIDISYRGKAYYGPIEEAPVGSWLKIYEPEDDVSGRLLASFSLSQLTLEQLKGFLGEQ